jgi:hypothetical protein
MKSKVKKFGRGGDILTALGAGLAGYGAYKYFNKDKDEEKPSKKALEEAPEKSAKAVEKSVDERFKSTKAGTTSKGTDESEPNLDYESKPAKAVKTTKTASLGSKPAAVKKEKVAPVFDKAPTEKSPVKSVVFNKPDETPMPNGKVGSMDSAIPLTKKTVSAAADKAADTTVPKAFDMKTGNKTVYGNTTTDVFKQRAEQQKADAAAKAAKKAKADAENKEFRERSLSPAMKKGGAVKKMASGGMARSSASKRADGCAIRGKTRA